MDRWVWLLSAGLAACAVGGGDAGGPDAGGDANAPSDSGSDAAPPSDSGKGDGGADAAVDAPIEAGVAVLQVNEVGPNVASSADLIELFAKTGGDIGGITIEQDITTEVTLATLPTLHVAAGDYVVVHLNAPTGVTTETTTKADCSNAACYAGAWDVVGGTTGITFSGRVILARAPNAGAIQDGVAFYNSGSASPATFYEQVEALQDAGAWLPASCSGNPCSSNALAQGVSANWNGTGTTTAKSIARTTNQDTSTASDWAVGTSSFGATNP